MRPFTKTWRAAVAAAVLGLFMASAAQADTKPAPSPSELSGKIDSVGVNPSKGNNYDRIAFTPTGPYGSLSLPVARAEDKLSLSYGANKGDLIWLMVDDPVNPTKVVSISRIARPVGLGDRWWTLFVITVLLLGVASFAAGPPAANAATGARKTYFGNPAKFLVGHDGRLSNSQVQLALWFGVVAIFYTATLVLRASVLGSHFIGGIGLTTNVLAMTGLSALAFGGAKIVTTQKAASAQASATANANAAASASADAANAAAAVAATTPTAGDAAADAAISAASTAAAVASQAAANANTAAAPTPAATVFNFDPKYLFQNNNGETDLGDLQMILISIAAVAIFAWTSFYFLGALDIVNTVNGILVAKTTTLPDVDSALLGAFGLGQGAYLVKKAALPLGQG